MTNYIKAALAAGGLLVAGGSALYYKLNKIAKMLGVSVMELSKKTNIDVDKALIDEAIQTAVKREVDRAVGTASRMAVMEVSSDLRSQVRIAVEQIYSRIEEDVSKELASRVKLSIDMDGLAKDVVNKAKKDIQAKFDGKLDDILVDFNQNLSNVSKIYSSIAGTVAKGESKDLVFTVSK